MFTVLQCQPCQDSYTTAWLPKTNSFKWTYISHLVSAKFQGTEIIGLERTIPKNERGESIVLHYGIPRSLLENTYFHDEQNFTQTRN